MKKRLLSIVLSLVMILGLMPAGIFAASAATVHAHCVCGKSGCSDASHGEELTWIGISSLDEIGTSGNYYLTKSIEINERWYVFGDTNITLCLNGYSISCRNSVEGDTLYAAILNHGTLTITDCDVSGTITYYNPKHPGTIIYNRGGTVNLWNGSISGNDAGHGVFNSGTFNMYGGKIRNNKTPTAYRGGGVLNGTAVTGDTTTFNMYGGEITGNTATGKNSGGGVYNRSSATFNMYGGKITDNTATGDNSVGGMYNFGILNLSDTPTVTDNNVGNVYLHKNATVTIVGDGLDAAASVGITAALGKTVVNGTTNTTGLFCDNASYDLVSDGEGGLKLAFHADHRLCGEAECNDADHGNVRQWKGITALTEIKEAGNYYLKQDITLSGTWACNYDGVNLCLNGKTITGKNGSDAIRINRGGRLAVTDCQSGGKITHNAGKKGLGIFVDSGGTCTLWNGNITGNTDDLGGGVCTAGGSWFTMIGGSITNNTGNDGGGLHSEGTTEVVGGLITDNTATYGGGGLDFRAGTFTLSGTVVISGNTAKYGGGVYINRYADEDAFTMTGGSITDNTADECGGGVYNYDGTFNLNGGSITANRAKEGGGVFLLSSDGSFKMTGGSIAENTATVDGGGVYNNNAAFTMEGGSIADNTVVRDSSVADSSHGGGVYNNCNTFKMTGGSITGNAVDGGANDTSYGGGVYNRSEGTFEMSGTATVSGNTANYGGGVVNFGTFKLSDTATIADNIGTLVRIADRGGGGVFNAATFTMTGGEIKNNKTSGYGGGVCNVSTTFTMEGGSITGNSTTAGTSGGGVFNYYSTFTMSGASAINNNTASSGGGVKNVQGTFNMNGGEIKNNKATGGSGGGVYNVRAFDKVNSVFNMTAGTISGNSAYGSGGGVYSNSTANSPAAFNMSGGEIIDNTASSDYNGGGVWNGMSTFTVSGKVKISGNVKDGTITDGVLEGGTANNVYLYRTAYPITIESGKPLSADASIGITGSLNRLVVSGTTDTTGFFCDNDAYKLVKTDDNNGLKIGRDADLSGKLLTKADGEELTDGKKTYDKEAVVFADVAVKVGSSAVEGATYTYTWQKNEGGTYTTLTELTDATGPVDAGNYQLIVTAMKDDAVLASAIYPFTIERAKLNVVLKVKDKVYDGKTETDDFTFEVSGTVGNDVLTFDVRDVNFADANVGENKTVTAKFEAKGEAAKNYTVPETVDGTASITPRSLTVNVTAKDKTYDGSTAATVNAVLDMSGAVENDEVTLVTDGVTAAFDTKDFGKNKPVTLSGSYTLSGAAAGNYTIVLSANLKATIDKKELTVEDLLVADKYYDGTDTAIIKGTPTLRGVVGVEDVTLNNGTPHFADVAVGENIAVSFTAFSLSGADAGNYTLVQPTGITASIRRYVANKSEYTVNSNDWLNTDFVVTVKGDWQLSRTNTADGVWSKTLTESQDQNDGVLHFYVRNKESGIISEMITETYKIDKTAPTGTIRIADREPWQDFVNKISFGLFFRDKQTVTIAANDTGSGVKTIAYLVSVDDLSVEQLADMIFTTYAAPFGIEPDAKVVVYARITDAAGNVKFLRTDGIVLDATAPSISGADNGKIYCGAVTLTIADDWLKTVTLNEKTVTLTDGKLTLAPAEGTQTVVAIDEAGNKTTLTVTVNNGHTWGEWSSNGDGTHTRICAVDKSHTETKSCSGGTATCQEKAVCSDCHATYGDFGPHDWDMTAWGYIDSDEHARTCKTVGCTAHDTLIAHTPDREAATEDDPVLCRECGYELAAKLGHICANHLTPVAAKAATCTEAGNKAYYVCNCGKLYENANATIEVTDPDSVVLNALGHDWAPATCTQPKTCKRDDCNATDGSALGHRYANEWSSDANSHWHTCAVCKDKGDLAQHTPDREAATEDDPVLCRECGYELAAKLGHICANHLTPVAAKAATCTEAGNKAYYVCNCGKLYENANATIEVTDPDSVILDALGHSYSEKWSCDASGHWHACQNADCTDRADVAEHIPGADATETTDQICTECGYVLAAKLGHICANHLTPVAAKAPTCTEAGNKAYYACDCGKLFEDADASVEITKASTVVAALGHDYEWKIDKEATAAAKGFKHEECKMCHGKKTAVEIPAIGETGSKTGDNSMLGLWLALLLASAFGIAGTTYSKKKRRVG